jgi:olefin beta-lactone synthetase
VTGRSANIADALTRMAERIPNAIAIHVPKRERLRRREEQHYTEHSYAALDGDSSRIARGLLALGFEPQSRAALMVKPSYELFAVTFALFKAGIVPVLIDPGIGITALGTCLAEASPSAFIGIPQAHAARVVLGWARQSVRRAVVISAGRTLLPGGVTLDDIRRAGEKHTSKSLPLGHADNVAAILFTSGSTGIPKGAVYTHGTFTAQVDMIRTTYAIAPGEIDLPTFPLFGLFDPALGMTTVLPDMDFTRPARVDPRTIIEPIVRFGITNMFGSPALLNRIGRHGKEHGSRLPTLRRVISAGAPVPANVLATFGAMLEGDAEIVTPYGATEALPVATIGSREVLADTRAKTDVGAGVCVGRPIPGVRLEIIAIRDDAIATWSDGLRVPRGEIGELVVAGANVTRAYFGRAEATRLAKIEDGEGGVLHRMGDVGYLDDQGRLWFCGRKAHRVVTRDGTLFTDPCEAVFTMHPDVYRAALVGVTRNGQMKPVMCIELEETARRRDTGAVAKELLTLGARLPMTAPITTFLFHKSFPVDTRHNAKIFREKLAVWANGELS